MGLMESENSAITEIPAGCRRDGSTGIIKSKRSTQAHRIWSGEIGFYTSNNYELRFYNRVGTTGAVRYHKAHGITSAKIRNYVTDSQVWKLRHRQNPIDTKANLFPLICSQNSLWPGHYRI